MKNEKVVIFWFRRDLRLEDNVGLHQALRSQFPVLPVFIFDQEILGRLDNKNDRRVDYFQQTLQSINETLKAHDSKLSTFYGKPLEVFKTLEEQYDIRAVFCNRDYEPQAIKRDTEIFEFFKAKNIPFKAFKDQVIFDKSDIVKSDRTPYTVYSPYAKRWRETLTATHYKSYPVDFKNFFRQPYSGILSLEEIGFQKTEIVFEKPALDPAIIDEYEKYRDYPAMQRTTQLGIA